MKEIIAFFKDIFMIDSQPVKVGLTQFNREIKVKQPVKKTVNVQKEVKLSDLMRKSA